MELNGEYIIIALKVTLVSSSHVPKKAIYETKTESRSL